MLGDRGLYALSPFLIGEWAFCLEETYGHPRIVIPRLCSEGRNGERPLPISFHSAVSQPLPLRGTSFQRKEGECRRNRAAIPRTSPSGRPFAGEGERMPSFRIVISSESEKSFPSPFPMPPSLSLLGEAPPPPFRDTVFPVPCCQTLSALPPTKKIHRLRLG